MDLIFSLWKTPHGVVNNQDGLNMKVRKEKNLCDRQKVLARTVLKKPSEIQKWQYKHHKWLRYSLLLKTRGTICQVSWDISWMPIPSNQALSWSPWAALVMSGAAQLGRGSCLCSLQKWSPLPGWFKNQGEGGGNSGERLRKGRMPSKAFLEKRKEQKHCSK